MTATGDPAAVPQEQNVLVVPLRVKRWRRLGFWVVFPLVAIVFVSWNVTEPSIVSILLGGAFLASFAVIGPAALESSRLEKADRASLRISPTEIAGPT